MLSDTIQFVVCPNVKPPNGQSWSIQDTLMCLLSTGWTWAQRHENSLVVYEDFITAFLKVGTVVGIPIESTSQSLFISEFMNQMTSIQRTSKPRDFILALMLQYGFYIVP